MLGRFWRKLRYGFSFARGIRAMRSGQYDDALTMFGRMDCGGLEKLLGCVLSANCLLRLGHRSAAAKAYREIVSRLEKEGLDVGVENKMYIKAYAQFFLLSLTTQNNSSQRRELRELYDILIKSKPDKVIRTRYLPAPPRSSFDFN